jgi:hypothetical protein
MYDLTQMQVQERIAEIHRVMDRVNGVGGQARQRAQRTNLRVAIAQMLLSLAAGLAPPEEGRQRESQPIRP